MGNNVDKNVNDYFSKRRSIRRFEDREVESQLLDSILLEASKAPTCGNMQLYSVVVTRGKKERDELSALHFNQPASKAPVLLTICADFARFTRWCELRNADAGYDNFLSFTSAFADAMILAQQITTIAELKGLGTCYLGTAIYNAPEISRLLKLPKLVMPVACLAIGWPAEEGVETERLPLNAFVHEETYREDSDEEILELFKTKEEYPANQKFVEENAKQNLAQVFAEVRYPREMNEEFSEKLLRWLDF
ncbi:MAG: NADPH-dependent oxidoreductase [Bacteroides sp.]|nr:NADPH-dependent oxidoreductase [Bacteroides sp.]MDE6235043.1 nitroreductase family protein [Muribaculaceae bacterium]